MAKIKLLLTVHNNQPTDNFGWVFEKAFQSAYEPFIGVAERYPNVRLTLHYSGSLLEWLKNNKPEFVKRLKVLIRRRQVDLLTGGFYDPILPMLPDRDKSGQIALLTDFIKNYFEYVPKGVWMAERVWDEGLSHVFVRHGLQYTVLDEHHIRRAGVTDHAVNGYYTLSNGFKVFAADKKLRYIMPFSRPREIVDHFKKLSAEGKETLVAFADDGEKFGFWPHTYSWVYKKRWLEQFFEFLSSSQPYVETVSFDEAAELFKPRGVVDIPPSSYGEMMEWSKGDFNNFFSMYPEADLMRNRMLSVSGVIHEAQEQKFLTSKQRGILETARLELYKAQTGCAYWHGIFGGLYLSHLRSGVYKHLISAQNMIERLAVGPKITVKAYDIDGDEQEEVVLGNKHIDLYVKPDTKGVVFELDYKAKPKNIMTTIARRREPYHRKLFTSRRSRLIDIKKTLETNKEVNIHDILGVKEGSLKEFLVYDDHQKNSFIDYIICGRVGINDFVKARSKSIMALSKNPFRMTKVIRDNTASCVMEKEEDFLIGKKRYVIGIKKIITVGDEPGFAVDYTIRNLSSEPLKAFFATEFNWSLMDRKFLRKRELPNTAQMNLTDEWEGIKLKMLFNDAVKIWTVPVYTLNESEAGLEKTYQYLSILSQRPVDLKGEEIMEFNASIKVGYNV